MPAVDITLPESLRAFVEQRCSEEGYESVSQYLAVLVERDRVWAGYESLQDALNGEFEAHGLEVGEAAQRAFHHRMEELRRDLAAGLRALERGEYETYDVGDSEKLLARTRLRGEALLSKSTAGATR